MNVPGVYHLAFLGYLFNLRLILGACPEHSIGSYRRPHHPILLILNQAIPSLPLFTALGPNHNLYLFISVLQRNIISESNEVPTCFLDILGAVYVQSNPHMVRPILDLLQDPKPDALPSLRKLGNEAF